MIKLFIKFYSSYLNINQYEINIENFIYVFNNLKSDEIKRIKKLASKEDLEELKNLCRELEEHDLNMEKSLYFKNLKL